MRFGVLGVLAVLLFITHAQSTENPEDKYNFIFSKRPTIVVSAVVHVGMMGFSTKDYKLNFMQIQRHTESLYRIIIPNVEDEMSYVRYFMRYRYSPMDNGLANIESAIASYIQEEYLRGTTWPNEIVEIPAEPFELLLHKYYREAFSHEADFENRYVIIAIAPSWKEISTHISASGGYVPRGYRWKFNGFPTNVWIGKGKYVIMDLTSESVYIGPAMTDIGIRSPLSIPRLVDFPSNSDGRKVQFEASLASTIHSAASHLFFPDINFTPYIASWNKIVVPIIIFKNHDQQVRLNEPLLYQQIKKLFYHDIQLEILFGSHNIHDHKHLSMAISKSVRTQTSYELNSKGQYEKVARQFLDSKILGVELRRSADGLAKLLLDGTSLPQNTKVLPVYVFSLHGMDPELVVDDHQLVAAEHDFVVVLNTPYEGISVPLFLDKNRVTINGTDTTRHIIAGLALNQGLSLPYKHFSQLHDEIQFDYSWAIGHLPFGAFGKTGETSEIFLDALRRNAVVSRIHKGVDHIRRALLRIDDFSQRYLHGVLDSADDLSSWLEEVYQGKNLEENPLLYTNTVDRLHTQLQGLNEQLSNISASLRVLKTDVAFKESQSFLFAASVFETYSKQQLDEADTRLMCCNIHMTPPSNALFYAAIALGFGTISITFPGLLIIAYYLYRSPFISGAQARRAKQTTKPLLG